MAGEEYTAGVYTLGELLEGREESKISASDGAYICRVSWPDGTMLQADLVIFHYSGEGFVNPFKDVSKRDEYYYEIMDVYQRGLMVGTAEGQFSPGGGTTRGMLMAILWRLSGHPEAEAAAPFVDVAEGAYYRPAVDWAYASDIAAGVAADRFAPEQVLTREQAAAFLCRFAEYEQGGKQEIVTDLGDFNDEPSGWAAEAVAWAVDYGMLKADGDGCLRPQDQAVRAVLAVMLSRYLLFFAERK